MKVMWKLCPRKTTLVLVRTIQVVLSVVALAVTDGAFAYQIPELSTATGNIWTGTGTTQNATKDTPSGLRMTVSVTGATTLSARNDTSLLMSGNTTVPALPTATNGLQLLTTTDNCSLAATPCNNLGTFTINFSDTAGNPVKVVNPRLHISRVGGTVNGAKLSAVMTLTTTGVTLGTPATGTNSLLVSAGGTVMNADLSQGITGVCSTTAFSAGCGTIPIVGTTSQLSFSLAAIKSDSVALWKSTTATPSGDAYFITVSFDEDFGDAPSTYDGSTAAASHLIGDLKLGSGVTAENQTVINTGTGGSVKPSPSAGTGATGDSGDDGVSAFPLLTTDLASKTYTVPVTISGASAAGQACGWIDFNLNGVFDNPSERACTPFASGTTSVNLTWSVTSTITAGNSYARIRVAYDTNTSGTGVQSANGLVASGEVEDYALPIQIALKGMVFEDVNYGGGLGRSLSASSGAGVSGAVVEVYSSTGTLLSSTTTDSTGAYTLGVPANATYTVRVVNATIHSTRTGGAACTTCAPIQTFRTDDGTGTVTAVTDRVGGESPAAADVAAGILSGAQSITSVKITTSAVSGLDFGFNFDTVVNTNDSGQGSLRQFIVNSNALSNSSLAQAGQAVGSEVSLFMITDGASHPGLRSGLTSQLTSGVAVISPASVLPAITDANTVIDGATQTSNVGNTNAGLLGTGGTVGVDTLTLGQVNRPEVQIVGTNAVAVGLDVQASTVTLRGLSIYGFGNGANNDTYANIRLGNTFTGDLIEQNLVGISATRTAFDCPTGGATSNADNIRSVGADSGILRNNLIGCASGKGFGVENTSNSWTITNNEIRGNAIGNTNLDGIDLENGSSGDTVTGNLIVANSGVGVDSYNSGGSHTIQNNTITGNSTGNGETANVRLMGNNNTVYRNIIQSTAYGPGVLVDGGNAPNGVATGNKISQNSFSGNAKNAIDLASNTADIKLGDGITVNDGTSGALCGYLATSGNKGIDYPTITGAVLAASGGAATLKGTACPSSTVEVYRATVGTGDTLGGVNYGEGSSYLGSATTDASGNWTLSLSGLTYGTALTSIVTDAGNNTSEFSANVLTTGTASVTLTKLVRNIGSSLTSTTGTFSDSAAAGKPGEYLEYCIAYSNTGSGVASGFGITDAIAATGPAILDGYGSGQGLLLASGATLTTGATAAPAGSLLTSAADADAGTLTTGSLTFSPGTLASGSKGVVCFKAKVP